MSTEDARLRQKFELLDTNNDGSIDWQEFEDFVSELGVDRLTARSRFWRMDSNRDDQVTFAEFKTAMARLSEASESGHR